MSHSDEWYPPLKKINQLRRLLAPTIEVYKEAKDEVDETFLRNIVAPHFLSETPWSVLLEVVEILADG